ncbi:zinc finger BED domain-containing protein RICESLEEPER 2-like [Quercus robur]|uniref:zinc finger BED domain-containing protein RICESLEEPER 2-like n=1 Tax=Quercus robur TaxID=38942 RepID=UPI0021623C54|nr:zinc finger BED domain-containing protein RICESLEEPER 2-like [Quercus robur]
MDGEEGFQLIPIAFTVEASRKALAKMVIIDEFPFRFVEGYGFQRYSTIVQPKLRIRDIPSCQTLARDVIGIYGVEREKLNGALKGHRVCLTTDTWTSIQNLNYMSLTFHFIDDDWKLHKRILNFCQVEDHKGKTIGRKIEMCLCEWGINGIFTLTVNNASSTGATIKFLQTITKDWKGTVLKHEFLHMRCCAHILNLIMGDGLREIDASIAKVHEAVRYVKSSPNRNQTFMSFIERLGIESKSLLCLDVPTRWNSTYLMLETVEKFEKAFIRMDFENDSYFSYFMNKENSGGMGSPSGSLYVIANTFFDEMFVIQENIAHLSKYQNYLLKNMAMVDEMIELVRGTLVKLCDYYSCVDLPNVQVLSGSEGTHIEGESIGCSNPYAMVNSRFEHFLEVEQFIGCSNEINKYLVKIVKVEGGCEI